MEKDMEAEEEEEDEKDEEKVGEEPGEVNAHEGQGRGGQMEEEKEEEAEPRRIEQGEEEGRRMRNIGDPRLPSKKEVDARYLTHVPYRNWCPHCVRGRGRDLDHRRSIEDERRVPEFSFDYCFMGDDSGAKATILVGRERVTGMTMATVVPVKGTSGQFAVLKVLEFLRQCGAEEVEVIIKTDQEPSIDALVKDVVKARGRAATVVEKSPVGSSGSNGVVERAVQAVEGLIRTLKIACEARWGLRLQPEEKTVVFIAEYAAYLLNKLEVGKDGKTAYERSRGKRGTVMAVEFGERLLWKVRTKGRLEKMNPRWRFGVFVGVKADSGEVWVATDEGLRAVRSVRRLPQEERWAASNRDFIKHVPWNKSGDDPNADGDMPEEVEPPGAAGASGDGGVAAPRVVLVNTRESMPKEFYIKRNDIEKHGVTKDCAGCRTMFHGGTRQNHSADCRERFRDLLKDESRVKRMLEKRKDFEEKTVEEETRRMERRQRKDDRKAEKRGRKRAAEDEDLDDERLRRQAQGEEGDSGPARGDGGEADAGGSRPDSSGDGGDSVGMDVGAVVQGGEAAWDDVRGGWLDREEVRKARMEEVDFMQKEHLWDVVPRDSAQGHRVVSVRWVDTNKGSAEAPEIRCRLVARDFRCNDKDREDLFAATPPWELKRLLMSHAADRSGGRLRKMLLIDVKKAHLYPDCKEDVYIELPEEVGAGEGKIGKLRRWLYGFRPAAANWENHYAAKLEGVGFRRGLATPVAFFHEGMDVNLVVHGDDFTFVGDQEPLQWVEKLMKSWYQVKVRAWLGPGDHDDKETTLLGRVVRWHEWGISCRSDPKYRRYVMGELGLLDDSKSLSATGTKELQEREEPRVLGDDRKYRSLVASVNYMATDQPDLQFACKEACREMSAPTGASWQKLKRLGRYLVGRQEVVWQFPWKEDRGGWKVWVDSDWAGDLETRKSTSGGIISLGPHCVKTWSSTQSSPALSSCEAEYNALVDGATRVLGLQSAAKELGVVAGEVVVEMATDSSAAKSYASRRGAGRIRHVEVKQLWLQQAVAEGRFKLSKILGTENPADVMTKYKTLPEFQRMLSAMNVDVVARARGREEKGDPSHEEVGWIRLEPGRRWADALEE